MFTQKTLNDLGYKIVGCAIEVHKHLGPGLLESVYESCLVEELRTNNLKIATQVSVPINYKGKSLDSCLRVDILVEDVIVLEIKCVEKILAVHKAQLLSYLRLMGKPKGFLINFYCTNITDNLIPYVTEDFSKLSKE